MKIRRIVSVLIGLLLIALMSYKLYEVDMKSIPAYLTDLPNFLPQDIVNAVIFYVLFGVKVIVILLIAFGGRKALITSLFLLPIVIGEIYYFNWPIINILYNIFQVAGLNGFLDALDVSGYFYLLSLVLLFVFWVVLLVVVAAKKTRNLGAKLTLLIIGAIPLVLYFVDVLVVSEIPYVYEQWETIHVLTSYGLPLFFALMVILNNRGKPRHKCKTVWFPAIETL